MHDAFTPIADILTRARRVLITTHVRPDGDALGSSAAMSLGLKQLGIESEVLLLSHLPRKYAFIFNDHGVVHHDAENGWPASLAMDRFDALLIVDTGTWSQLPGLRERILGWSVPRIVVDHHLTQEDWADRKLVVTTAAAAGEIVADLLEHMGVKMNAPIATAIFLALVSDTGWFQFSSTQPKTLRLAADLMAAGVDTDHLHQLLYQNERPARLALQTRALQSLELLNDDRLAVLTLRRQDFLDTHADVPDTENLVNLPLQIGTVEASLLITEPLGGGPTRVSLRSKGGIDVAAFAQQFGGGGHARAAGLKLDQNADETRDLLVRSIRL